MGTGTTGVESTVEIVERLASVITGRSELTVVVALVLLSRIAVGVTSTPGTDGG